MEFTCTIPPAEGGQGGGQGTELAYIALRAGFMGYGKAETCKELSLRYAQPESQEYMRSHQ